MLINIMNSSTIFFSLTKNKHVELSLYRKFEWTISFVVEYTTKTDHAGFTFNLNLLGLEFEVKIYDSRHWNDDENRWYLPGEEQREFEENGPKITYGNVEI